MQEPELENKIAAWRARVDAAMPGQEETVRELEAHLRDHIELRSRRGIPTDVAFAEGVARLGDPGMLAQEFARFEAGRTAWWEGGPTKVIYRVIQAAFVLTLALTAWNYATLVPIKGMLATGFLGRIGGGMAMVAGGVVGGWSLLSAWRRSPTVRERRWRRREIFRMSAIASVLTSGGIMVHVAWLVRQSGRDEWHWTALETGVLTVLLSTWLLLAVQLKKGFVSDRVLGVLAVMVAAIVTLVPSAPRRWPILPYSGLCGALILTLIAVALWQMRTSGTRAEGRPLAEG